MLYGMQRGPLRHAIVDGVDVLVETIPVDGTEYTSGRLDDAVDKMSAAFDRSQQVITAMASNVARAVGDLGHRGIHPDQVSIEFGLSFSAEGKIIIAGATVEAALKVNIVYDRPRLLDEAQSQPVAPPGS